MTETSDLFAQTTCADTANATSSPASVGSPTPAGSRAGRMTSRSGPVASPASRSASQVASARRRMTATSGRNCAALLHRRDPLYSWAKMLLASSRWASTEFSLTWKPKATPAGRLLFQLAPSTPRIDASASGSSGAVWPTAVANDDNKSPEAHLAMKLRMPGGQRRTITSLQVAAKLVWPTATANDPEKRGDFAAERRNGLPGVVKAVWSTPRASDGEKGGPNQQFGSGSTQPLPAQAVWATPTTRDHKDASSVGSAPENGMLGRQVKPSPVAGYLNPEFVFWLMGYPQEFLSCAPPAMRLSRRSPPKSSAPCATDAAPARDVAALA